MSQTIESISLGGIPNTKSCLWKTLLTAGINKKAITENQYKTVLDTLKQWTDTAE